VGSSRGLELVEEVVRESEHWSSVSVYGRESRMHRLTLEVLPDTGRSDALGQDNRLRAEILGWSTVAKMKADTYPSLDVPRDDDLRGRDAELFGDCLHLWDVQGFFHLVVAAEGRVCLQEQAVFLRPLRGMSLPNPW
jgi:hypothetical protein